MVRVEREFPSKLQGVLMSVGVLSIKSTMVRKRTSIWGLGSAWDIEVLKWLDAECQTWRSEDQRTRWKK